MAVLGSSKFNIVGPCAAFANICTNLAAQNGQEIIPRVVFIGGIISFIIYLTKLEKYCTMIPTSVLEGFSLGIATTIGLG